jgi:hypothetical protein
MIAAIYKGRIYDEYVARRPRGAPSRQRIGDLDGADDLGTRGLYPASSADTAASADATCSLIVGDVGASTW